MWIFFSDTSLAALPWLLLLTWAGMAWWTFRQLIRLVYAEKGAISRSWFFACLCYSVLFPAGLAVLWIVHVANRPPRPKPDYTPLASRLTHFDKEGS